MRRVLIIAQTEFLALVRTKFFIFGIVAMPVLMGGLFAFMSYAGDQVEHKDRTFAVVDRTGALYDAVAAAALVNNADVDVKGAASGPKFFPARVASAGKTDEALTVELSERVRKDEIFAFMLLPAELVNPDAKLPILYYSQNTSYERLSDWLRTTLRDAIQEMRFSRAGVDPALVSRLSTRPDFSTFSLIEQRADGTVTAAREVDEIEQFGIPFFFLILMFMAVMTTAQHLINTIIEEKMSKISEVLLGSVSPFQLMAGKLLGIVAVSFLLSFVYLGGGIYALVQMGRPDLINPAQIGWFLIFLVCATLMFGSVFQALSSACSDLKDAQSMLQPAMMILIASYVISVLVIRAPDSTMATVLSLIPMVAPFAMMIRLTMPPGPPMWEVLLGLTILAAATVVVLWAAGRIFRVGLLMQGKPPNLPELLRWVRR